MMIVYALLFSTLWSSVPSVQPSEPGSTVIEVEACVVHSASEDSLGAVELAVLKDSLEDQLRQSGRSVSPACQEPWRVVHTADTAGILITLSARGRDVRALASDLASIPAAYGDLVDAVLTGKEIATPQVASVGSKPSAPRVQVGPVGDVLAEPEPPRWTLYARLGLGGVPDLVEHFSTSAAIGYRYTWERWAVDLSSNSIEVGAGDDEFEDDFEGQLTVFGLRAAALFIASPGDAGSLYGLGGLGYGAMSGELQKSFFSPLAGEGADLHVAVGYLGDRSGSFNFQAELGLRYPMYDLDSSELGQSFEIGPVVSLTVGFGWKRRRAPELWR